MNHQRLYGTVDGEFDELISGLPKKARPTIKYIATDSDGTRVAFDAAPYKVTSHKGGGFWWHLPGTNSYRIGHDTSVSGDWENSCIRRPSELAHFVLGGFIALLLLMVVAFKVLVGGVSDEKVINRD